MPIAPQITWKESESYLALKVKIPGLNESELRDRVKFTSMFFSITLAPYLLQVDFMHEVDVHSTQFQSQRPYFIFIFNKLNPGIWGHFQKSPVSEDIITARNESLRVLEHQIAEYHSKVKLERDSRKKIAQKAQWAVDQNIRDTIEDLERKEKETVQDEIANFLSEGESGIKEKINVMEAGDPEPEIEKQNEIENSQIFEEKEESKTVGESAPARKCVQIGVSFTPWDYVTPKRGNKQPPNFAKQSLINPSGERNFEETQPLFLRDKGNTFFEKGDFESALTAFSESVAILPQPSVYIARAVCNFKSDRSSLALADVKIAIQQLEQAENPANEILGCIMCFEGLLRYRLQEFSQALDCWKSKNFDKGPLEEEWKVLEGIKPQLISFKDLNQIKAKQFVEGSQELLLWKEKGDTAFQSQDFDSAIQNYDRALEVGVKESKEGRRVLLNRSAAYLISSEWGKSIQDCDFLLDSPSLLSKEQRTKAYVRRGTCHLRLSSSYADPSLLLEKSHLDFCIANSLGASRSIASDAREVAKLWNEIPKPAYYFGLGEYQSAAEDFLTLSQKPSLKLQYLTNASTCYLRLLQLKRCEIAAKQCLDLDPEPAFLNQCKLNLALCECYRGNLHQGKSMLQKILDWSNDAPFTAKLGEEIRKIDKCISSDLEMRV